MSKVTIESILDDIAQLPLSERNQLRHLLGEEPEQKRPNKKERDRRLPSKPMPPGAKLAVRWIAEHAREYAGQWVALEGERLIANGEDHNQVWAAAKSDGAEMPLIAFVNDPDEIYIDFCYAQTANI